MFKQWIYINIFTTRACLIQMDLIFQHYEQNRVKDRLKNSDTLCAFFSLKKTENCLGAESYRREYLPIKLMFYEPPAEDNFTNKAVARWTSEKVYDRSGNVHQTFFAHVELAFGHDLSKNSFATSEYPAQVMSFSINQYSDLYFRLKTFRPQYRAMSLNVDILKYQQLFKLCSALAAQNIKFDFLGMYSGRFIPDIIMQARTRLSHGTFCSRIITEVLQECEIGNEHFLRLKPWRVTPNQLSTSFQECSLG